MLQREKQIFIHVVSTKEIYLALLLLWMCRSLYVCINLHSFTNTAIINCPKIYLKIIYSLTFMCTYQSQILMSNKKFKDQNKITIYLALFNISI